MLSPSCLLLMLAVQHLEVGLHLHLHISWKTGALRAGQVTDLETQAYIFWVPAGQQEGRNTCLAA